MVTYFAVAVLVFLQFRLDSSNFVTRNYDLKELEIGSTCRFNGNKSEGICREIRNCPGAYRDFRERNISPTNCAFGLNGPIVCCGRKRRYETACAERYGDRDTDKVCPVAHRYECSAEYGPRIIHVDVSGGVRAGPVPHMVALGWRNDGKASYKCGGTLISGTFVLTAAHCTIYNGMQPTIVRIGAEHLLKEHPDSTFEILEIFIHPEYKPPIYYHDIALIRFEYIFRDRLDGLEFACLPPEHLIHDEDISYDASEWGPVEALGYGSTSFGGPTDDMHLIKVNIDLLPDKTCLDSFPPDESQPRSYQKTSQICAGDVEKGIRDTCQGDSGGPLQRLLKETYFSPNVTYVFGVTSFGRSCASGSPGVYTRVTSYLDWIESIVWPMELSDYGCSEDLKLCLKIFRNWRKLGDPCCQID